MKMTKTVGLRTPLSGPGREDSEPLVAERTDSNGTSHRASLGPQEASSSLSAQGGSWRSLSSPSVTHFEAKSDGGRGRRKGQGGEIGSVSGAEAPATQVSAERQGWRSPSARLIEHPFEDDVSASACIP